MSTTEPRGARVVVLVGNPKPASRTLDAAVHLATELAGAVDLVVDLAEYGPRLLDWSDEEPADLVRQVGGARLLVVASPTYKASFTGLLKLFLDRIPGDGLVGTVAVPLMLAAGPGHAMAPEVFLRPVLTELGATVPPPVSASWTATTTTRPPTRRGSTWPARSSAPSWPEPPPPNPERSPSRVCTHHRRHRRARPA
ncbi:MAG: NADPH-dependent FMN reductase [Nocardioides sp.]|uniref:NADPH-dependent FMN reductase n=1 Tax=Nocardioides sp. TaxID=35761 RepID=UPI003F00E0D8